MFTIDYIKEAHSKVKSGADFPAYIQDLKKLGVLGYTTFVQDGHTDYYGPENFKASTSEKYPMLSIATASATEAFKSGLKDHQQGKTNYMEFIEMCAAFGVEKWTVDLEKMTCAYFDVRGHEILIEIIPDLK